MRALAVSLVAASVAVSFLARTVGVVLTARRYPELADWIRHWWRAPFVIVCLVVIWAAPRFGIPITLGALFMLTRESAVGSPFRPRR